MFPSNLSAFFTAFVVHSVRGDDLLRGGGRFKNRPSGIRTLHRRRLRPACAACYLKCLCCCDCSSCVSALMGARDDSIRRPEEHSGSSAPAAALNGEQSEEAAPAPLQPSRRSGGSRVASGYRGLSWQHSARCRHPTAPGWQADKRLETGGGGVMLLVSAKTAAQSRPAVSGNTNTHFGRC